MTSTSLSVIPGEVNAQRGPVPFSPALKLVLSGRGGGEELRSSTEGNEGDGQRRPRTVPSPLAEAQPHDPHRCDTRAFVLHRPFAWRTI